MLDTQDFTCGNIVSFLELRISYLLHPTYVNFDPPTVLQKAGRNMEHTLIAAYVGLLLGYLIMDNKVRLVGYSVVLRINDRNRSTKRKPALLSLCPPQIPHDLILSLTQATAVAHH
jgi:hypothetical protein